MDHSFLVIVPPVGFDGGNIWTFKNAPKTFICITTNGLVRKDGALVMGRGVAKQAKDLFPHIDYEIGTVVTLHGNHVYDLSEFYAHLAGLITFPVKHNWWEKADKSLIQESTDALRELALRNPEYTYVLPRPGCGNGGLRWEQVKPIVEALPDNVLVIDRE